jgi:ribonuclease BN (tRNA processing enzyme)
MKLIFLGSGSAFTVGDNNYHSNMLLEDSDKNRLLIDCGSDARLSLYARGLTYRDITDVYISHLHADHAGGLEWLAFTKKFDSIQQPKPILHISEDLVDKLWKNVLSGGLMSLHGTVAELSTYFTVRPIAHGSFCWQNIDFDLIHTVHVFNGSTLVPSYGLMFNANGLNCFITADTQFAPEYLMKFYNKADIIFHDCETAEKVSYVHAHYNELTTLDPAIKAKMWLYHYNPGPLPDAVAAGFRGFVKPGQCFDF